MAHTPTPTGDRVGAAVVDDMTTRAMADDACWRHLGDSANGRVVLVHHGRPLDVPVHHVVDGRTIVFRTGAASPLGLLASREPVRFEVDDGDASTSTGWSVLVAGEVRGSNHGRGSRSIPHRLRGRWDGSRLGCGSCPPASPDRNSLAPPPTTTSSR